jgi:hypothetical protein
MAGWYAVRKLDKSTKAVIALTLLALALVAALPVALLAGLILMLRRRAAATGHLPPGR